MSRKTDTRRFLHTVLIGNPNCGKTTLYNSLTGEHEAVGNWSGVTVDLHSGFLSSTEKSIRVTDLPGVYSLNCSVDDSSAEVCITYCAMMKNNYDVIINVVDACHLERHLYLTTQLLELNRPLVLVLSMTDVARKRGITINQQELSAQLGCPVFELDDNNKQLVDYLVNQKHSVAPNLINFSVEIEQQLHILENKLHPHYDVDKASYVARRILEGDSLLHEEYISKECDFNLYDLEMADARYSQIHQIVLLAQKKSNDLRENITAIVDRFVLNRFLGIPIFLAVMYLMFFFSIYLGGMIQEFFDLSTSKIFVQGCANVLTGIHAPHWLIVLCSQGIGQGIHITLTFIPVIGLMFLCLSWLEASGYMARAAFVMDRVMRLLGLPGKAFVPLIIGFGCNVPAILATRTLNSKYDRILTIMMLPFMSCSARLAIYAVFVAAFFPKNGYNVVFSLYLLGVFMAILTGMLLRKTLLKGQSSSLIIELPAYHIPTLRRLHQDLMRKLSAFLWRASKLIIPVCIILNGLNFWFIDSANSISILAVIGKYLTPIFSPIGISADNWPATVSLLTGMLAKEVVIGSLNELYMQLNHINNLDLIPSIMQQHFVSQASAYAYLVFILLYVPCVSTMAAIRQESNITFMWISTIWSLLVAYAAAVICYQCAMLFGNMQLITYLIGVCLLFVLYRLYKFLYKGKFRVVSTI